MEVTTKGDIVTAIWSINRGVLTRAQVQMVVDQTLATIKGSLVDGVPVKLKGFGSFRVTTMPAGKYHNPKTLEPVMKDSHKKLRFKIGKVFKRQLNGDA